jgi:uncharacterized ubiquitin-like protein YukD
MEDKSNSFVDLNVKSFTGNKFSLRVSAELTPKQLHSEIFKKEINNIQAPENEYIKCTELHSERGQLYDIKLSRNPILKIIPNILVVIKTDCLSKNFDSSKLIVICPLSNQETNDPYYLECCNHAFDKNAYQEWLESNLEKYCPICSVPSKPNKNEKNEKNEKKRKEKKEK